MFAKILCVSLLVATIQAQFHGLGGGSSGGSGGGSSGGSGGGGGGESGHHHGSSYIQQNLESYGGGHHEEEHHHHAHPKYSFKYGVEDKHTGDNKEHEETRDGHTVKGSYSLHEPDGTILTVHYTADKHSGFNAQVHREGHAIHPHHHGHH